MTKFFLHLDMQNRTLGGPRPVFGGLSIYITFQLFGYLPASQSSLHRYTDMSVVPAEGMMAPPPEAPVQ